MKHLERVFFELPTAEQEKIDMHAQKRGCTRLEYLGQLLEKDLAREDTGIRNFSIGYRFAKDEDFGVKTFTQWLRMRRPE